MAPSECGKVLALLSLASVLLLLADALPFRHHGPSPVIADLLLAALARLDGVRLLDLATRRNMILLCHAILLVLLGDAGILGIPARRRQGREATAAATTAASACCYYFYSPAPPEQRSAVVVWQQSSSAAAAFAAPSSSLTEPEHELQVAEDHMSDKQEMVALAAEPELVDQPASSMVPMMDADQEEETSCSSRSMEEGQPAGDQHVDEEEEDLDEMNRRFEAFIAATKEKMRLEAMQQPVVGKRGALLVAR